jgi:hypothetical protein
VGVDRPTLVVNCLNSRYTNFFATSVAVCFNSHSPQNIGPYALSRSCSGRTTRPRSPSKQNLPIYFRPTPQGTICGLIPIKSPPLVTKPSITGSIKRTKSCQTLSHLELGSKQTIPCINRFCCRCFVKVVILKGSVRRLAPTLK